MLASTRETMETFIAENVYTIVEYVRPTKDNGFGKQVPNLTEDAVLTTLGTARISRRSLPDVMFSNAKTPYDYTETYYLTAAYDATWLRMGIVFEYYGQKFRTLFVENRIIGGGIAYKLCDLEQVTTMDVEDFYD